jgi:transcriptional/translational regulatory protein YebC/TACO1
MALNKKNGSMAGAGSTAWLFAKKGFLAISKDKAKEDELMDIVLEAGAEDLVTEGDTYEITTDPANFEAVKTALDKMKIQPDTAEMTMIPSSTVKVVGNEAKQVLALMEALEDHEDVQAVYANFDIPDDEMEKISE